MSVDDPLKALELVCLEAKAEYETAALDLEEKKKVTAGAEREERVCKDNLARKFDALSQATEGLNRAQEEIDTTRRAKFRAVVRESGILTRFPRPSDYPYYNAPNSPDSLGYSATSPIYSPTSPASPIHGHGDSQPLSPLVPSSVIDSW